MKEIVGNVIGWIGIGLMAFGVWLRWPWAGFVVGGIFLFAVGTAAVVEESMNKRKNR